MDTSLFIDPSDKDLIEKIENLKPYPGYCIFIDIVGSTKLKDESLKKWIISIYNTFANSHGFFWHLQPPLKSIGDCLMFYFPENNINDKIENALSIFANLSTIAKEKEPIFQNVKISICFCEDVYNISFIKNTNDVYGKDIDLTSRLLNLASSQEIFMNEKFYKKLKHSYDIIGNKEQFSEVEQIVGPWPQQIKGFQEPIHIYKLP